MSLSKLALTAAFLLSVCSPVLAETTKSSQPTAQNTNSVLMSQPAETKTPKTQQVELHKENLISLPNNLSIIHCCACTGSYKEGRPSFR